MSEIPSVNWSEVAASNNAAPPDGWPEGTMLIPSVNDAARENMSAIKKDWNRRGPTVTSGGAANVQTLTYGVAPAAYTRGDMYSFVAGFTNTGATTINANGLGAKAITKNGTNALTGGEIVAAAVVTIMYDGTQFQLVAAANNGALNAASWGGTAGGAANVQTITLAPVPAAYFAGMAIMFRSFAVNTGATTINANGLGAKNIFNFNAALVGGELPVNAIVEAVYDGVQFQLISATPLSGQTSWGGTAGGTGNAQTVTLAPVPGAYYSGMALAFRSVAVNTGAATVNVNGLGIKNIFNFNAALVGGELPVNAVVEVVYDGVQFQMINAAPSLGVVQWGGVSGGTANAQTVTLAPVPGAYVAGQVVAFKAGVSNTGPMTLNVNGLGAKNVFLGNAALTGGEITINLICEVVYDGTQFQMITATATGRGGLIGMQIFQTAGTATYTPTVGTNSVIVFCQGAGGAGGGTPATAAGQGAVGGGGGAGAIAYGRITAAFAGVTVTIGAAGTGVSAANGNNGGTSSFGALFSAPGGGGGLAGSAATPPTVQTPGGSTGNATGGTINMGGSPGHMGMTMNSGSGGFGGRGADAPYGMGGYPGNGGNGQNASGKGAGGAGGARGASGAATLGGDGVAGLVIVMEFA